MGREDQCNNVEKFAVLETKIFNEPTLNNKIHENKTSHKVLFDKIL